MPFVLQMTKAVQRPGNEATESESWWYLEWLNIDDVIVMCSPSSRLVPSLVPRPAESGPGIRPFSLLPHTCVISGNQALFGGGRGLGTYSSENTVQLISQLRAYFSTIASPNAEAGGLLQVQEASGRPKIAG